MKHILYKDIQGYALTPEDNYNIQVVNANKITHFDKRYFDNKDAVMKYIINILKLNPELVLDRTGENTNKIIQGVNL